MFIRFVAGDDINDTFWATGVITIAKDLIAAHLLEDWAVERIEDIFSELNLRLPVPPFSKSNWPPEAVSWFKDSAKETIALVREIEKLLKHHDIPTRTILTDNPGKILYEDDYQIIAEIKNWVK